MVESDLDVSLSLKYILGRVMCYGDCDLIAIIKTGFHYVLLLYMRWYRCWKY